MRQAVPEYLGRVAVVTGAASGIGYAVASRAAAEGMTVVLADIDAAALHGAAASLRGTGADEHPFGVDVSDRESHGSGPASARGGRRRLAPR